MAQTVNKIGDVVVLVGGHGGHAVVPQPTPLTRLNYFDGKFLRADDLIREQEYLRNLVSLANQAGGWGVVYGLDARLTGEGGRIELGPGLAIDGSGRAVLLPQSISLSIDELIDGSRQRPGTSRPLPVDHTTRAIPSRSFVRAALAPEAVRWERPRTEAGSRRGGEFDECVLSEETPPSQVARGTELFLVTVAHAEALCGEEDVYGRLCEEACATATDRPFKVEGVVVRAVPLGLDAPLATSGVVALDRRHLRSQVASAYYADEARGGGNLISKDGLSLDVWCLGARLDGRTDVPIGVLARAGVQTVFLDAWIARRERIEAPARRYWGFRMAMRPWEVFLAQILQFQCQLRDCAGQAAEPGGADDPCRPSHEVLRDTSRFLAEIEERYRPAVEEAPRMVRTVEAARAEAVLPAFLERISDLKLRVATTLRGAGGATQDRVLIRCGIVELPSAGFLPVTPGSTVTVNTQVRQLMGEGVDLRFCVCRPDFVGHALEQAQHLERISLLQGLDHPDAKPEVDVLVPNGEIVKAQPVAPGRGLEGLVRIAPTTLPSDEGEGRPSIDVGATPRASLMAMLGPRALADVGSRLSSAEEARTASAIAVHGAGRSEALDPGGFGFHFAGATEAPRTLNVGDLAHGLVAIDPDILREVRFTPDETHAEAHESPLFLPRLNLIAADAVRRVTELRATRATVGAEVPPAAAAPGAFRPPVPPAERRVVALWTTMRCERNLLAMEPGETTPVSMIIHLAMPAARPSTVSYQVRGDLRVDQVSPGAGFGRRITGRLFGIGSVRSVINGAAQPERSGALDAAVVLTLSAPAGQPAALDVQVQGQGRSYAISATWTTQPLQMSVAVSVRQREVISLELASATLHDNPEVLKPGNPVHTLALSALDIVGASLGDPDFDEAAANLLFPPPPPQPVEQTVRATMDWVMFHRRREVECGEAEAPAVAPPRRYQVYQLRVADEAEASRVRGALMANDGPAIATAGFAPVDVVEFAGGLPTLTTGPENVRLDWSRTNPGNVVLHAAIATVGGLDGEPLGRARLTRLESVLAPVSSFDRAASETLPQVPDALAAPGTDGVITFITLQVETTTCHTVFALNPVFVDHGLAMLRTGDLGELLTARAPLLTFAAVAPPPPMAIPLGTVTFQRQTAEIVSDEETRKTLEAWNALGGLTPTGAFVFSRPGDEAAGDPVLRASRAQSIATLFGGGTIDPQTREVETIPGDCPAVTVVIARGAEAPREPVPREPVPREPVPREPVPREPVERIIPEDRIIQPRQPEEEVIPDERTIARDDRIIQPRQPEERVVDVGRETTQPAEVTRESEQPTEVTRETRPTDVVRGETQPTGDVGRAEAPREGIQPAEVVRESTEPRHVDVAEPISPTEGAREGTRLLGGADLTSPREGTGGVPRDVLRETEIAHPIAERPEETEPEERPPTGPR